MDNWPGMYDDPFAVERIRKSVELLRAESGQVVLDVGCYKMKTRDFLPEGITYYGLDNERYLPEVIDVDLNKGFSCTAPVDRILCLETLEHLVDPHACMKSIKSYLKKDGICVISLPNEASLFHRFRALFGTIDQECFSNSGKHLHLPGLHQCVSFLEQYFEIVERVQYISHAHGSRSVIAKLVLRLFPKWLLRLLSNLSPSLFARGFIFVCKLS